MRKLIAGQLMLLVVILLLSTSLVYGQITQGKLQVTPDTIDFGDVEAYSTDTATAAIIISNCGDGDSALCWRMESGDSWIGYVGTESRGVIILPDNVRFVNFTVGACGLCVAADQESYEDITGVYEGSFVISQYFYDESNTDEPCQYSSSPIDRVTVMATMTISEYNVLEVDKEEIDFGEDVENTTLDITNAGEGTMEWEAVVSADTSWLTIDGGSGANGKTISGDTDTLTVSVDRSMVEGCADEYLGFIKITSENATPAEEVAYVTMNKKLEAPQPASPTPLDGATDQSLYATLAWQDAESGEDVGGIVRSDVYFSTNQTLVDDENPSVLVCDDIEVGYCDPNKGGGSLDANTTYYWRIKAVDECAGGTPAYGGTWGFTTGAALQPACPVSLLLPLNDNKITTLRKFRDEVLTGSFSGEKYVDLYYSHHAIEMLLILLFNPELRMCAHGLLEESLPAIQSLLRGETATVAPEIIEDMENFLEEFGKEASPELRKVISGVRKNIMTGDLLEDLGFFAVQ